MITSMGNAQIRQIMALKKKPRERSRTDLFLVEGPKMFREVPGGHLVKVYMSDSFYKKAGSSFLEKAGSVEVVSDEVFGAMSDTKTPQGVLCLVRQFHYREEELLVSPGPGSGLTGVGRKGDVPLVMALENLQDPGNLGTIMRTAEGAGVTGILLSRDCVDIYNPKVIRSTMGSVYRVPFLYTDDLRSVLRNWKNKGLALFAAHLKGTCAYDREDYAKPAVFLIGNESQGLTEETASLADHYIRIPMLGQVESLNAAVASAILMYEAARQRRNRIPVMTGDSKQ